MQAEVDSAPFDPLEVEFRAVSARLSAVRIWGASIPLVLVSIAVAVVALSTGVAWVWLGLLLPVGLWLWLLWLLPRQVRAIGYATTPSDFVIRRGIMFRTLSVVPYGRIQFVDVSEGPVDRLAGLATVRLHTASASSDAVVPGLPTQEASDLRELLVRNGAGQLSGL